MAYENFNQNWKFQLADNAAASQSDYDDSAWRTLNVPHDWSVEAPFNQEWEGCTGYLPGGIGWYRKHFQVEPVAGERTYVLFDGVYNNSEVWLNGEKLGEHPYGYSPFYYELTPYLKTDADNVLSVRVDHSRYADSRWYTGSGLYRDVKLVTLPETHIPIWGVFVTTPEVSAQSAVIEIETKIRHAAEPIEGLKLQHQILDPSGQQVVECVHEVLFDANEETPLTLEDQIPRPVLWDTENPALYTLKTELVVEGKVLQQCTTRFGVRSFKFDANAGFSLNGKSMKIKGVCLHHDGGLVGAAVPDAVWRRRLKTLQDGGCNAIRMAHNPPSEALLDLCDEMGLLVQNEFFDEWDFPKDKRLNMNEKSVDEITRGYCEHFQTHAESDLKVVMLRDRNHPSIMQWSIGNEIEWTYPRNAEATGFFDADWSGNYFWDQPPHSREEIKQLLDTLPRHEYDIGETAQKLAAWTRELDITRPVIANCILPSSSYLSGYSDALDVIGFSYRRVIYDYGHEHHPDLPLMGTENLGQWHDWKAVIERDFVAGLFLWTGVDYIGESNGKWPQKTNDSGLLDTAGFPRGSWHMMKSLWCDEPHLHLVTQTLEKSNYIHDVDSGYIGEQDRDAWQRKTWIWHSVNEHWNYSDGETTVAEVYSNAEEVELFLNGESLGTKLLSDFPDHIYKWVVPFAAGTLEARAPEVSAQLVTAGVPALVEASVDGPHVLAQIVDDAGNP
ncbi:MAG: sugar-binding domain-containing protein, partial [Verrucomicrobiota bacterium]